jgi:regulator of replication initiation timing
VLKKPIRFSYKQYTELREAYEALLADNQKLMVDNRRLREKLANLEIRCRIAEGDDENRINRR